MESTAFADGFKDGTDWDLDDFDSIEAALAQLTGWDEATINAMGSAVCAKRWGVPVEGDAWTTACREYNDGVLAGLRSRSMEGT